MKNNNKTLIILGPTATGKTKLAVQIANQYNSEIISADSRQVYKYLDIGTGKDLEEYQIGNNKINYHLIDIINPNENYSVYNFQRDCVKARKKILLKNKNCIICGGTGLYIESLLLNYDLSSSPPPNKILRKELYDKDIEELKKYLSKINNNIIKNPIIDTKNRIIRNIEICLSKKIVPKPIESLPIKNYRVIGINPGRQNIRYNITKRLQSRIDDGMINEVIQLLNDGVTHDRLNYFGLEYRLISQYINESLSKNELFDKLNIAIHQFAKKQMTFFRRMEKRNIKINWIKDNINEIKDII